jgi:hypothetical protein
MATILGAYDRNDTASQEALKRITAEDVGTKTSLHISEIPMAQIIQVVGATTYVCDAPPGTLAGSASWRAKKIVEASGTTTITWADGNASFDNIASNRATLTYS